MQKEWEEYNFVKVKYRVTHFKILCLKISPPVYTFLQFFKIVFNFINCLSSFITFQLKKTFCNVLLECNINWNDLGSWRYLCQNLIWILYLYYFKWCCAYYTVHVTDFIFMTDILMSLFRILLPLWWNIDCISKMDMATALACVGL